MKPSEVLRKAKAKMATQTVAKTLGQVLLDPSPVEQGMSPAIVYIQQACGRETFGVWFSRGRTHAEVLDLFDRAIALAVEEEEGK